MRHSISEILSHLVELEERIDQEVIPLDVEKSLASAEAAVYPNEPRIAEVKDELERLCTALEFVHSAITALAEKI